MARVLIVDDEKSIRNTVSEFLRMDGHAVQTAEDAEAALALLGKHIFDVVVSDIILPRVSGVTLLQRIKERAPDVQVVMMTGEPTVDTAVEAVRAGACDYLSKPVGKRELLAVVAQAASFKALLDEKRRLEADNRQYQENLERMVGERTEALAARTRQLEAVREVSQEIARELDLSRLLELIHVRAATFTEAETGVVWLWDAKREVLQVSSWHGLGEWMRGWEVGLGNGVAGTVAQRRASLLIEDYLKSPYANPVVLQHGARNAVLGAPLLYRDRLLGVIVVDRQRNTNPFTDADLRLLEIFAAHAAIAIENARLYDAVRRDAAHLEDLVVARTAQLAAASQHKSAFLANMSHELRTPLNSILGFAQLLQEQTKEMLSTKQTRYLTNIYTSGQHLLTLINDILDLSKVEAGKIVLSIQSLAVGTTLEDLLIIARGLAHPKEQTVRAEVAPDLPALLADPVRFKQIFFNLVSNAVKFTPNGGTVTVTARRIAECGMRNADWKDGETVPDSAIRNPQSASGEFLELAVADTGAGIRPEDLPRLFTEFTQLATTAAQAHEGTGLGLALTKRLVELHGGTITAASDGEGQGSTFTVVLPVERRKAGTSAGERRDDKDPAQDYGREPMGEGAPLAGV